MKIRMTDRELEVFVSYIEQFDHYLEFGCGGSTYLAADRSLESIWSVESDPEWIEDVKRQVEGLSGRVNFHHADVGKVGKWGRPLAPVEARHAARYYLQIFDRIDLSKPHLCLVDGRFRLQCAILSKMMLHEDSVILFHDFVNRPHFNEHRDLLGVMNATDTLAEMRAGGNTLKMMSLLFDNISNSN